MRDGIGCGQMVWKAAHDSVGISEFSALAFQKRIFPCVPMLQCSDLLV